MGSSGLIMVASCGLAFFGCAAVEPRGMPDECARCFAENRRLAGRLEQLLVRVGQLEAELATKSQRRGVHASCELTVYFQPMQILPVHACARAHIVCKRETGLGLGLRWK